MAAKSTELDVIVIGGGPAGLSAALWCTELGLDCLLVEKEPQYGGQLLWTHNPIDNHLGITALNGTELRDKFIQHLDSRNIRTHSGASVEDADLKRRLLRLNDSQDLTARAIIIATGVRRRHLNIPGEERFRGRGILESGAAERKSVQDKNVVIIGGGDAALENALILSRHARAIFLVHRRSQLTARAEFVDQARSSVNIQFLPDTLPTAIKGHQCVESVELENRLTGEKTILPSDHVLLRIGVLPNSGLFSGQIDLDDSGYIQTREGGATSLDAVFAIGDVAHPHSPTISAAVGNGAAAAKEIFRYLRQKTVKAAGPLPGAEVNW